MESSKWKTVGRMFCLLGLSAVSLSTWAANECRIEYGYNTIKNNKRTDHKSYRYINKGQTVTINQNRLNYVKSLRDQHVRFYLNGASNVTLHKNQVNPPVAYYIGMVKLVKASCLNQGGASQPQTPAILINSMKAAGATVGAIANALKNTFNLSYKQIAQRLKAAGYAAEPVIKMLKNKFNVSANIAGGILKDVFNFAIGNAAKVLSRANYAAAQIGASLRATYNASEKQVGQAMKQAGYDPDKIGDALHYAFQRSEKAVARGMKAAGAAPEKIAKKLIKLFGRTSVKIIKGLEGAGFSVETIGRTLKKLGWARKQVKQVLEKAGHAPALVEKLLDKIFGAVGSTVNRGAAAAGRLAARTGQTIGRGVNTSARNVGTAIDRNAVSTMKIRNVFHGVHPASLRGSCIHPTGITEYVTTSIPLPNTDRDITVTLAGDNLMPVTSISGLPGGANARITARGKCGIQLAVKVPRSVRTNTRGSARLMVNNQRGPAFRYVIGAIPSRSAGGPRVGGRVSSGGGGSRPDLRPYKVNTQLYKVGTATTLDQANNLYTALNPFNNSAFCQGIPQGGTGRTGGQTANRSTITVSGIVWGVKNHSGQSISTPFTIQLRRGNQVVATQTVNSLNANQVRTFTYIRPNSQTCVARVGIGGGCYHCGGRFEGWNDNPGYSIKVDSGAAIDESNEFNNQSNL